MQDTSSAALKRYYALLREQSPMQRLNTAASLSRAVKALALEAIRAAYPGASVEEERALLAERLYGRAVADRVFRKRGNETS